ncbi:DUF4097 family beta strand repeat-containing protein [Evansella sp. AB-rgal1]|uniref:DUF4097 family beta strand repeat-containing protein n=1 Tax=Evansella sp. AB-rgal1 TaxID=3242696 RepID=UPI00359EFD33
MQEERKMILKMIEDGKISAEEGLQLLNALKDDKKGTSDVEYEKKSSERSVSTDVEWEKGADYRYKSEPRTSSFATKFTEFIEEAVQKIKEFDLDFNFGSSIEIEHIFQHRDSAIEVVDVSLENGSVTFKPWEERDVRVECNVKVYKVRDSEEARNAFLDEVTFEVSDRKLRLHSPRKTMKVNTIIYVPKEYLEKVKLYAFNGRIIGDTVDVEKIEVKTVNGRISFDDVLAVSGLFETVNGSITIGKLDVENCDTKTVNGTISVNALKGKLDAETLNGSIKYTLADTVESRAYIKTTTGSIIVVVPKDVKTEGELKSTVGSIHCDLPELSIIEEKKEFASKQMSFLSNKEGKASFYVEAEATTGSIHVRN